MGVGFEPKAIQYDVATLAKQFGLPPTLAQSLLQNEIQSLEHAARVRDFIPLLALKHVKERLQEQSSPDLSAGLA